MPAPSRSPERRVIANKRYTDGLAQAGAVKVNVLVPSDKVVQIRKITSAWRAEAKLHLPADRPSAEQILLIHSVCWALQKPPPIQAFETRALAAEWLAKHEKELAAGATDFPRRRRKLAKEGDSSCSSD